MTWLLWMFPAYRQLWMNNLEKCSQIRDLERIVADLERQLAARPATPPTIDMSDFEKLFIDQPYEGGKIPDEAWLTPGEPDR